MNATRELRYCPAELRAERSPDGFRSVSGYAAKFSTPSVDLGGWREVIAPGAFSRSLQSGQDVMLLRDHDMGILLGRTASKTLDLSEDSTGLRFRCDLPSTTQANDMAALLDRGDLRGCSFGFVCRNDSWSKDNGQVTRTIIDADLFDVSIVSSPAYPDTSVSIRSAPVEIRSIIEAQTKPETRDSTTGCSCMCDECADDNCDGCLDPNCTDEFCSCAMKFRNRVHFAVELARRRAALVESSVRSVATA